MLPTSLNLMAVTPYQSSPMICTNNLNLDLSPIHRLRAALATVIYLILALLRGLSREKIGSAPSII